jgi:SOS-response transcriptional repressor LexA
VIFFLSLATLRGDFIFGSHSNNAFLALYTVFLKCAISFAYYALKTQNQVMKTGDKIRQIRNAKNLTLAEVENRAGLSEGNLSRVERGKQWLSEEKFLALAAALDVKIAEFFTDTDAVSELQLARAGKLPLISWVQAGAWSEIINNFHPGDAEDWMACPFRHGQGAFILRIVGESMYDPQGDKSYKEGELIVVDPSRDADHKSMVVIRLDDEKTATFKQLLIEPNGKKMLMALNPSWPNRIMEITTDATVCGVVIGKLVPEY